MGTYTAFHLQSTDIDGIQETCSAWLAATHRSRTVSVDTGKFPSSAFVKVFDDKPPTILVIGQTRPDWVTIHYNSFFEMEEPVARLSGQFGCLGVVVLAQTVSDYYLISVHRNGENVRVLEFTADVGWLAQEGAPLPFEQAPLGEDISEPGEEPCYFFRAEEAEAYCNNLGFSIFDEYEPRWVILRAKRKLFGLLRR
jgi:hypothetical protein